MIDQRRFRFRRKIELLLLSSRDTTQLIMKAVMHELDYDINDDDLEFLYELNRCNKAKRKKN